MNTSISKQLASAKSKLFGALVGRPASSDEDAVDQLCSTARAAFQAARRASQDARERFDDTGADTDLEMCLAAEEAERAAQLHVERAERIAARAAKDRAAAHRAELVSRRAELTDSLSSARLADERKELEDEHIELMRAAVSLFAARKAQQDVFDERYRELHRVQQELRAIAHHEECERAAAEGRELPADLIPKFGLTLYGRPVMDRVTDALYALQGATEDHIVREHIGELADLLAGRKLRPSGFLAAE